MRAMHLCLLFFKRNPETGIRFCAYYVRYQIDREEDDKFVEFYNKQLHVLHQIVNVTGGA